MWGYQEEASGDVSAVGARGVPEGPSPGPENQGGYPSLRERLPSREETGGGPWAFADFLPVGVAADRQRHYFLVKVFGLFLK